MPLLLLTLLAAAGSVVGIVVALRAARSAQRGGHPGLESGLPRLQAVVHSGPERVLLGVQRELGIGNGVSDAPYGGLYLDPVSDERVLVRTRSEIGRGLVAVLTVRRLRGSTSSVDYSIVRLPDDEDLHDAVLALELRLVLAVRRLDRQADVRLTGTGLRDIMRRSPDTATP